MKLRDRYDSSAVCRDWSAEEIVEHATKNMLDTGELERLRGQVCKLTEIVGRLVGRLPESEWLEVAGVYGLEAA